jgi:hypothetical protein
MFRQKIRGYFITHSQKSRAAVALLAISLASFPVCYGCANLTGIREFAKTSAEAAAFQGITQDFVTTLERREALVKPPGAAPIAQETLKERKDLKKRLDAAQHVLVNYMKALEALSSDDLIVYNMEVDALGKSLDDAKIASKKEMSTYKAAVNLIVKISADAYRQRKLKEIIPDADPYIGQAITLMKEIITDDYLLSISNEEDQIDLFFDKIHADAIARNVSGLSMLARISSLELRDNVQVKKQAAEKYLEILDKILEGHRRMTKNISLISSEGIRTQLLAYRKDIERLYKAIKGD